MAVPALTNILRFSLRSLFLFCTRWLIHHSNYRLFHIPISPKNSRFDHVFSKEKASLDCPDIRLDEF